MMFFSKHFCLQTFLLLATTTSTLYQVQALPDGATQCPAGQAAVGGAHLQNSRTVVTGALEERGFQVTLHGQALVAGQVTKFGIGQDHVLRLQAASGRTFRGFLMRLGMPDDDSEMEEATVAEKNLDEENELTTVTTVDALQVGDDDTTMMVKVAEFVCVDNENVGGLTHTNAQDKTLVDGILRMDTVSNQQPLPLDVTVVVSNKGDTSEYYYTRYWVQPAEAGSDADNMVAPPTATEESEEVQSTSGASVMTASFLSLGLASLAAFMMV